MRGDGTDHTIDARMDGRTDGRTGNWQRNHSSSAELRMDLRRMYGDGSVDSFWIEVSPSARKFVKFVRKRLTD